MDAIFRQLFMRVPQKEQNEIFLFGNENDGDCFEENDFDLWRAKIFYNKWRTKKFLKNAISRNLLNQIINNHEHVIDIACGPGMGLIPSIKQLNPLFLCMASDANSFVLNEWQSYLEQNEIYHNIDFAQFSLFNIPIKSNIVQAYSSFNGISSTRNGEEGYRLALSEIHRTLDKNGFFYTIENEWRDVSTILSVFERKKQQPWSCFCEKQLSWHERFIQNGFEIVYEEPFEYRSLQDYDNELGMMADELGVDIGVTSICYIVKKFN